MWFVVGATLVTLVSLRKIVDLITSKWYISSVEDRYILITGCDTGFGNLAAKRLDSLGCHVFAACLTETGETDVKKSSSTRLTVLHLDVTSRESVRNALKIVKEKLPAGKGLDGLLNNAAVSGLCSPIELSSVEDYRSAAEVNLYGLIDVTLTFLPLVKKARGRVVNTSSIAGRVVLGTSFTPYVVTKYGVEAFSDRLRQSMRRHGVKVVLVEPAGFRTTICNETERPFRAAWARASAESKQEFGEDFLEYYVKEVPKQVGSLLTHDPNLVAETYELALLSRYPKARYVPGAPGIVVTLFASLPEWALDKVSNLMEGNFNNPLTSGK